MLEYDSPGTDLSFFPLPFILFPFLSFTLLLARGKKQKERNDVAHLAWPYLGQQSLTFGVG